MSTENKLQLPITPGKYRLRDLSTYIAVVDSVTGNTACGRLLSEDDGGQETPETWSLDGFYMPDGEHCASDLVERIEDAPAAEFQHVTDEVTFLRGQDLAGPRIEVLVDPPLFAPYGDQVVPEPIKPEEPFDDAGDGVEYKEVLRRRDEKRQQDLRERLLVAAFHGGIPNALGTYSHGGLKGLAQVIVGLVDETLAEFNKPTY